MVLEACRLVCLCLGLQRLPASSDRRANRSAYVGILVACQTTVHRLSEKAHQSVLHVTTAPTLLQTLTRRLRQSQCIIQLATGQQPSVRGDGRRRWNSNRIRRSKRSVARGLVLSPIGCLQSGYAYQDAKIVDHDQSSTHDNHYALHSATSGADVTDYGKPCRVDMGNVG